MKKFARILVLAVVCVCPAGAPPFPPGDRNVEPPIGRLGYRIGTLLTIEGTRAEKGKVGTQTLAVDTVNGFKLAKAVSVWIENVELPGEHRCVFKGYETGGWVGTPDEVVKDTEKPTEQVPFHFKFSFVVTSVLSPKNLKLQ